MKLEEFYKYCDKLVYGDYIVKISYKYQYEKVYSISNEIISINVDLIEWLNDWYEGQEDVEILGIVSVNEIIIPIYAKWEQLDTEPDTFFTIHKYKCSNCGKIQLAKSKNIKNYRYCSKCGADMRDEEYYERI